MPLHSTDGKKTGGRPAGRGCAAGGKAGRGRQQVREGVMPVCGRIRLVLREARLALGLTLCEAARRAGIDRKMYRRVEEGWSVPTVDTLERMCGGVEMRLLVVVEVAG